MREAELPLISIPFEKDLRIPEERESGDIPLPEMKYLGRENLPHQEVTQEAKLLLSNRAIAQR